MYVRLMIIAVHCADVEGTIGVMDKYDLMEQDDIGATLASANKQQPKL